MFVLENLGGYISFSDPSHLLKSISDLRQRNLLSSFSNVKRCAFSNLPNQITFSKPSQYIQGGPSQSEYLLSSFSNLPHQITFSKPSQHIQGGPSQSEYLLSSFSNGVPYSREQEHVLLFRKSSLGGCYNSRHVTKRDVFLFINSNFLNF